MQKNTSNKKISLIIIIIVLLSIVSYIMIWDNRSKYDGNEEIIENGIDQETTRELFKIDERVVVENNYFTYDKYEFEVMGTSIIIWQGILTNLHDEELNANIRVKFYNEDKVLIGNHLHTSLENELLEYFSLLPNESKNVSFTVYDDDLFDGYELLDIMYYSIEDIN